MNERAEERPFWWFGPEQVAEIAAYFDPSRPYEEKVERVEVHRKGDGIELRFINHAGSVMGAVNDSNTCPPDCPGDPGGGG